MTDKATDLSALSGRRILVVEDEMLLAMELQMILEDEGCVVLGPVPDIPRALALVEGEALDAATLDMNLNGESRSAASRFWSSAAIATVPPPSRRCATRRIWQSRWSARPCCGGWPSCSERQAL